MKAFQNWGLGLPSEKPLLISGPCSAETEEQTVQTCIGVAQSGANMLRAGIWKPRTRPNSFEGVGEVGLPWLALASKLTGLPACTEVANGEHVEMALKHGIQVLWIGARTTVNPFAVQEIADALKGVDIPVLIKNPVNPDIELWIGALERLQAVGIDKLAAVHRGFSVYGLKEYRNAPLWEFPIELRRRLPELPIINDPSHICGRRDIIAGVAQTALELGFDGLMIESHINPDTAWSDAKQQITPSALGELMKKLECRYEHSDNALFLTKLTSLREQIDALDAELIEVISRRMEVAREIGLDKKANGVAIFQPERWNEMLKSRKAHLIQAGLSEKFAEELLTAIHKESIFQQTEEMKKADTILVKNT